MNRHHEDWITREELQRLSGWSERTIFRKQGSGELRTRQLPPGRNGKPVIEYAAASLPADLQLQRMKQKMESSALVPVKQSISAVPSLPEPKSERVVMALDALDADARQQAEQRLKIIAPLVDFVNRTNGHKPLFRSADGQDFESLNSIVKHLVRVSKFSERSIREWWKRYKEEGPGALADRARSDAGKSRIFIKHREAASFCRNKYLNEHLSVALVHRALIREWQRLTSGGQDRPPDYKTLRIYLQREIQPLVKMIARDGDKAYHDDAAPYIIRDISAIAVNQVWISDHMIHDVWVRNDGVFPELAENEALRPWLTCITDMRSRRVVAPTWCATPSSRSVASALLIGMRLFGRPGEFYIDNGKDYNRLSDEESGVLFRLGVESRHCLPKHPQSKQIESFFRTVHQQFDVLWRPFYCGTSPATRPEECDAALRLHKKLVKEGRGAESPLPLASQFIAACARYLDEFNEMPHTGQGMNRRSPNDVYDAELPPERRLPVNPADVAQLFWERDTRKVCEGGCVRLDKWRYEPADQESFAQLMLIVGTEIIVARDPRHLHEAIALTNEREPRYLGLLRSQEMAVHGETDRDVIRLRMRKEGRVRTAVKQLLAAEAHHRALAGDVTEAERFYRRAVESAVKPNIHALPVPKAVGERAQPRPYVDDIVDGYFEDK